MPLATGAEKVRENRARRAADRQGLRLHKSAQRDRRGLMYGKWALDDGGPTYPDFKYTLDEIEQILRGERER